MARGSGFRDQVFVSRMSRMPGTCGCPRANGRHCDVHDPRPDPGGNRAQRRAAKKAKRRYR
jgi:hypothetical protein